MTKVNSTVDHMVNEGVALKTAKEIQEMLQKKVSGINGFNLTTGLTDENIKPLKEAITQELQGRNCLVREINPCIHGNSEVSLSVRFSFPGNEIIDQCRVIKRL